MAPRSAYAHPRRWPASSHRRRRVLAAAMLALFVGACRGAPKGAAPLARTPPAAIGEPAIRFPRELGDDARYSELTRELAVLHESQDTTATAQCLLQKIAGGYALTGELAPAIRPVPSPPLDLDDLLPGVTAVNILTPYGRYGTGETPLSLASLTYLPPSARSVALLVTDHGVHLRGARNSPQDSTPVADGLAAQEAALVLPSLDDLNVYVAAEANVPLSVVWELLKALETRTQRVALAVTLAPGTTLKRKDAGSIADLCPEGLAPHTGPEGKLKKKDIQEALSPLIESAPQCLAAADGRGAMGGRVVIALRISGDGSVSQACARENETGDRALGSCVVALTKRIKFPKPDNAGSVDVELPIRLRGDYPSPLPLLCNTEEPLPAP